MGDILKRPCTQCGRPMDHQWRHKSPPLCVECGVAKGAAWNLALSQHDPEVMEIWAAGLARAAMTALAECELRKAGQLAGPVPDDTRQLGYARRSRPVMRRNREVRELEQAAGP